MVQTTDVEVTRQFIIALLQGREGIAFPSKYATREETVHSDSHHSHWHYQQGNKNILLREDNYFCTSTNFASRDPTSLRDLTSFSFCLKSPIVPTEHAKEGW